MGGSTHYYVGGETIGYTVLQYSWRRGAWSTLPECPVRWFGLTQFTGRLTTVGGQVIKQGLELVVSISLFVSPSDGRSPSLPCQLLGLE